MLTMIYIVFLNSLLALLNSRDVMGDVYDGQPVSIHFSKFAAPESPRNEHAVMMPNKVSNNLKAEVCC